MHYSWRVFHWGVREFCMTYTSTIQYPMPVNNEISFVNPVSNLANDYLNNFGILVMMFEQTMQSSDFVRDIEAWQPYDYIAYFNQSPLPGRHEAIEAFGRVEPDVRYAFDQLCSEFIMIAQSARFSLSRLKPYDDKDRLISLCAGCSEHMRAILGRIHALIEHGYVPGLVG
jgi:hypothetical protein